jgi:hypothetical protein
MLLALLNIDLKILRVNNCKKIARATTKVVRAVSEFPFHGLTKGRQI